MDPLAQDLLKVGTKLINQQQFNARPAPTFETQSKFHKDNAVIGQDLQDYTLREPSEDGLYVKVTQHKERIELIEQPPTPEELAEEKEKQKLTFKITAAVAVGCTALLGVVALLDRKAQRKQVKEVERTYAS